MSHRQAQTEICSTCSARKPSAICQDLFEGTPATMVSSAHHLQRVMLLGTVASGYVHDLNNLLTVIEGMAHLSAEDLPPSHPVRQQLDDILLASSSAQHLARRLLSFVRRQPSQHKLFDLRLAVGDYLPLARRLVGSTIIISATYESNACLVEADTVQIEQILLNLLTNARDAMPQGGLVTIAVSNVIRSEGTDERPGEYVCLTVADTGSGLSQEARARLFEPFFSSGTAGGTGLGLSICHCIVCQLGGAIEVESNPGEGTTFRIYLPRVTLEEGLISLEYTA